MGRTATKSESSKRDAKTKLVEHRLSVLELARELGNVAGACRQRGLDRTSFYEWKRRFQTHGFEGLKDLPPIHKSHPQTTPPETVERIKELALKHPAYGCNRLDGSGKMKRTPHHFASVYSRRRDGDRGGCEVTGWRMDAAVAVDAKTRPPRLGHAADDVPTAPTSRFVIGLAQAKVWGISIERVCRAFTL